MDIMIDLETLGTRAGCVVLSIGAVGFNRADGAILREFYRVIDAESAQRAGLTIDAKTVAWWAGQSPEARGIFATDAEHWRIVADDFRQWAVACNMASAKVWAHGLTFDLPILEAALLTASIAAPWKHWNARDTRTVYDLTGFDPNTVPREGVYHNALDDARHQVKCLCAALSRQAVAA